MVSLFKVDFLHNFLVFAALSVFFDNSSCLERQLVAKVNPGCLNCNDSFVKVIHVRADGPNDTLHHVWCFIPKPTILIALTPHESQNVSIQWDDFPNTTSSISFSPQPYYSYGVLFNQIFEFNDSDDTGLMNITNNNSSYMRSIGMPDTWQLKELEQNLDSVRLVVEGSWKNSSVVESGQIKLELETYRKQDHGPKLPHLLHSANATQLELSLFNMVTKPRFDQGRFAVEIVMAANESADSQVEFNSFKSLDDEHTPGVFTLVDVQTAASRKEGKGGYLQWRPVAYVAEERDIVNSTETAFYSVSNESSLSSDCDRTLLSAFFGSNLNNNLLNAVNVSFGAKDDGFYSQSNASIWTVTVGYGHPPDENFSLLVILIMGSCLGLPMILIVISGLFVALRRITHRKDDLLLSE